MKVYQVIRKELKEIKTPYKFLDGDVYVIETKDTVWIWIGSDSYADEKAVGAWAAKQIEAKNRKLDIKTINEGEEPEPFKNLLEYTVVDGDTPGFLTQYKPENIKDYRLLRLMVDESGEVHQKEVEIEKESFSSEDVFVLDAHDTIYIWIGKDSQAKEKYEGGRISRLLEVERKRLPIIYTVEEGDEPEGFWQYLSKIARTDKLLELRRVTSDKPKKASDKKWWQFWRWFSN